MIRKHLLNFHYKQVRFLKSFTGFPIYTLIMGVLICSIIPGLAQQKNSPLDWATYTEGQVSSVKTDKAGNVYITGYISNGPGMATTGAYQTAYGGGNYDAFLAKFNDKDSLIWATNYGGDSADYGISLALDDSGNIYMAGVTYSDSGIASAGAFQTYNSGHGRGNAFIVKFSPSGSRLWGTYYGGNKGINGGSIIAGAQSVNSPVPLALDDSGNVYFGSQTLSDSGISTSGAFNSSFKIGYWNGFFTKFNTHGKRVWATYLGGNRESSVWGLSIATNNNIYITGYTTSDSGIATFGAYQDTLKGTVNSFLFKFSSSGARLWATYFGKYYEEAYGIATDTFGNIFITGQTYDYLNNLATAGAYQTSYGYDGDAFLSKFSSSGSLLWATYYGGIGQDYGYSLATDLYGNVCMAGHTTSDSEIASIGAYQPIYKGSNDGFLVKLSPSGERLWATYYGVANGGPFIYGYSSGVAADGSGNIYLVGSTNSSGLATSGAYMVSINRPTSVGYLAKFSGNDVGLDSILSPQGSICPGTDSIKVMLRNYGNNPLTKANINWSVVGKLQKSFAWTGNLATDSSMTVNIGIYNFPNSSIDTILTWASNPNGITDTISPNDTPMVVDTVITGPSIIIGSNISVCYGDTASIGGIAVSATTYSWVSKPAGFASKKADARVAPTVTTSYILTQTLTSRGCSRNDTEIVKVNPLPDAFFKHKLTADSVKFSPVYTTYSSYSWTFGDGDTFNQINPTHAYLKNGIYTVRLTATDKNGCTSSYQTNDTVNYTGIKIPTANSAINIYPNPTTSTLNIESATNPIQSIIIFDATGREVYNQQNLNAQNQIVPVRNFPSGAYLVKLGTNEGNYMAKFMKL